MNSLTVKIDWGLDNKEGVKANQNDKIITRFSNEFVDLYVERIHIFSFDQRNIFYNEETGVICSIIGYISNIEWIQSQNGLGYIDDVATIERLYSQKGMITH